MPKIAKRTKIAEEPCSFLTWIRKISIWFRLLLCHFFVMKLFCYEIQLCKEFAEVCIFCGSFIINSFWTHLSYVLKTGRRLFWKNEAKVRKRAWFVFSCIVKLEMAKNPFLNVKAWWKTLSEGIKMTNNFSCTKKNHICKWLFFDTLSQKYSRLRYLLHVKGLAICLFLGCSGSILQIRTNII